MLILAHALLTIIRVLRYLIQMYSFIIGIAVILSWVKPDPYNPIVRIIYQISLPAFRVARRVIPKKFLQYSFDPTLIVVFVLLLVFDSFVLGILADYAELLRRNALSH